MISSPYIARISKVRVRLHYTWYLAFILITAIVVNQFPMLYQLWQRVVLGLIASLIFSLTIGIRHLALVFIAHRRRAPLSNVTLFVFGGVCQLAREDNLPVLEVLIGVSGILFSLILAIIFYLIHMVLVITGSVLTASLIQWLAFITLMLTFFHIIPAFPLDGGRILLALLWKRTGDYYRAVNITAWAGWVAGIILILCGILFIILTQQKFLGVTLALIGLALERAATQGRRQAAQRRNIQDISARDIMSREYPVISRQLSVGQLVRNYILVKAHHYFVVANELEWHGIVTIQEIKATPIKKRDSLSVSEIMTPPSEVKTARLNQAGDSLLEQMEKWGIQQMPVLDGNAVAGIVARDDLIRLSQSRAELKIR